LERLGAASIGDFQSRDRGLIGLQPFVLWRSASSLGKNAEGKQDEPGFPGER